MHLLLLVISLFSSIWYVRTDGGTTAQCTGQTNAAYSGSGTAQPCAYANPQDAINTAFLGDTINLRAGDVFTGNFVLPAKSGSTYLTIQSTGVGSLPEGVRVSPSQVSLMATLQSNSVDATLATQSTTASHHYKFVGIEFVLNANNAFSVIRLGDSTQTAAQTPNNLTIDRCYIHGMLAFNSQRGITLNSASTAITNSYISEIHWVGVEAHGIGGWNGPGPFTITNNYIEAAGINILFGGAQVSIPGLVPSDILISNNYLFKPLSWRVGDPSYAGTHWTVKNLFELKNARRLTFTNNIMENSWADSQIGWAVIFNSFRDQGEVVEDIEFSRNIVRHVANGLDLRGADAVSPTDCDIIRMKRVSFFDNLLQDVGAFSGDGKGYQLLNGSEDVTFNHNTSDASRGFLFFEGCGSLRHSGLTVTNNLAPAGLYGVFGDGGFFGTAALNRYAFNWTFTKNAIYNLPSAGLVPSQFPSDNYFPADLQSSIGLLGTDGLPVGARLTFGTVCNWNANPACR